VDAYIFATHATATAVAALAAGVTTGGPARVVCPLIGSHELYVAVSATNDAILQQRVAAVIATTGLVGASTHVASNPGNGESAFPTHAVVDTYVGFALLTPGNGMMQSVYAAAKEVDGVIGAAVVTGMNIHVVVEATAGNLDDLSEILDAIGGITGVTDIATAAGATSLGTGFPT
jgi:hypothetical protein